MTLALACILILALVGNCVVLYAAVTLNPEDERVVRRWVNRIMDRMMR